MKQIAFIFSALLSLQTAFAEPIALGPKSLGLAQAMAAVPRQLEDVMKIGDRICGGTVDPASADKELKEGTRTYKIVFCRATAFGEPAPKATLIITEEVSNGMGPLHKYTARIVQ